MESWSDRIARIEAPRGIGTILHIGAGRAEDLPAYRDSGATLIVLVEPDPAVLPVLQDAAKNDARVRILPAAVAAKTGRAALHRLNLPGAASLRDLASHFPGLRVVDRPQVETLSAADLLARVKLHGDRTNILILEAAGEEAAFIEGCARAGALTSFEHLLLRMAAEALYPGAASASALLRRLAGLGFTLADENRNDPDFPVLHLRYEPSAAVSEKSNGAGAAQGGTPMEMNAAPDKMSEELAKVRAERDALQTDGADLRAELAALRVQIGAKTASKTSEELAKVLAERDALRASAAGLRAQLAALKVQIGELEAENELLKTQVSGQQSEIESQHNRLADVTVQLQELSAIKAARDALWKERDAARQERDSVKETVGALQKRTEELELRISLARQEHHRSEGQIAVIKDLLLREGGL